MAKSEEKLEAQIADLEQDKQELQDRVAELEEEADDLERERNELQDVITNVFDEIQPLL